MPPVEAELQYLENAKKLSLYGVHIYYAKVNEGMVQIFGFGFSVAGSFSFPRTISMAMTI